MKPKNVYLVLCIAGAVLPYSQLLPFLAANGLDLRLLLEQLFANRISAFFGLDVIVSALGLFTLIFVEGRRSRVRHLWAPVAATLLVGVSLGLPLFLYLTEVQRDRRVAPAAEPAG